MTIQTARSFTESLLFAVTIRRAEFKGRRAPLLLCTTAPLFARETVIAVVYHQLVALQVCESVSVRRIYNILALLV